MSMKVNCDNNRMSFKAYAASPVKKGIFITCGDIWGVPSELSRLADKTGLKVYSLDDTLNVVTQSELFNKGIERKFLWTQDFVSFVGDKLYYSPSLRYPAKVTQIVKKLSEFFGVTPVPQLDYVQGGNFILNKAPSGKLDVFVGDVDVKRVGLNELAKRYNADNVIAVPQADKHLDAFMFVIGKRAFVCDDNLMLKEIKNAYERLKTRRDRLSQQFVFLLEKCYYNNFKLIADWSKENRPYAHTDEAVNAIERAGYEVVKIPGKMYRYIRSEEDSKLYQSYSTNFANGLFNMKDGKPVIVTNESYDDERWRINDIVAKKIGFSFKNLFLKYMEKYVDPENIHFIRGTKLYPDIPSGVAQLLHNSGGINCHSTEIV